MRFILFYLAKPKYGGWPTYTAHLHRGLRSIGYEPIVIKVGNKTESKTRNYGRKIHYLNVNINDLPELAKKYPSIITAVDKSGREAADLLLEQGVPIVVHDPTELKNGMKENLSDSKIVVIRETMLKHLPNAHYIPHPYARRKTTLIRKNKRSVSISRVDFDKHTEIICEANQSLEEPIDIYGFLNTMYAHFNLDDVYPDWKNNYKGTFDAEDLYSGEKIAEQYQNVVDMSRIKGDGGGTQYTFLEAANANSNLILHTGWEATGLLADYAQSITTTDELIDFINSDRTPSQDAIESLLNFHDATKIASNYQQYFNWPVELQ